MPKRKKNKQKKKPVTTRARRVKKIGIFLLLLLGAMFYVFFVRQWPFNNGQPPQGDTIIDVQCFVDGRKTAPDRYEVFINNIPYMTDSSGHCMYVVRAGECTVSASYLGENKTLTRMCPEGVTTYFVLGWTT